MEYLTPSIYRKIIDTISFIYNKSGTDPDIDLFRFKDVLDSFSEGQFQSKTWAIEELNKFISVVYLNAVSLRYHRDIPNAGFREIKNFTEYRLNSSPSFWRKKDLLELTHNDDSPWSWEIFGTYRTFNSKKFYLSPSSVSNNIFPYAYKKGGAIYRGKWVAEVIDEKIKKYNISLDTNKRGYSNSLINEKRSFFWKLNFILSGFKTDGRKALWFLFFYLKNKTRF